jgi:thiol-disulfide isomerase/thioredoxin
MIKPALKFSLTFIILVLLSAPTAAADIRAAHPFLKPFFKVDVFDPPLSTHGYFFRGLTPDYPPVQPIAARGRWVILNLWATWCAPCLAELPQFATLHAQTESVDIWAVSVDKNLNQRALNSLPNQLAISGLPLYHDYARTVSSPINTRSLPATLIIDPSGQVRAALYGQNEWASPDAHDFIATLPRLWPTKTYVKTTPP